VLVSPATFRTDPTTMQAPRTREYFESCIPLAPPNILPGNPFLVFTIPTFLTVLLLGSSADSIPKAIEPSRPEPTTAKPTRPVTFSFGASYGALLLPSTGFGSGLGADRLAQGEGNLSARTIGAHLGLSGERLGGGLDLQWLRGDGRAPAASFGQFPTHGEALSGFVWGGSIEVFAASRSASIRPLASAGLRYLKLHRRLDHDTLAVGRTLPPGSSPTSSVETSFDQKGFLLDLSGGLRFRLGQVTFVDARIGALSGDALGSQSLTSFALDDSRHMDPYLRFGLFLEGVPAWMKAFGTVLNRNPGSPPVFTPL
jgi:hypothetical protein